MSIQLEDRPVFSSNEIIISIVITAHVWPINATVPVRPFHQQSIASCLFYFLISPRGGVARKAEERDRKGDNIFWPMISGGRQVK